MLASATLVSACSDDGDDMSDDVAGSTGEVPGGQADDDDDDDDGSPTPPDIDFPDGVPRLDRDTLLDFVEHSRADIDASPEAASCHLHTVMGDPVKADGTLDTSDFSAGWHLYYHCDEDVIAYYYTISAVDAGTYPYRDDTFAPEAEVVEYAHSMLDSDEVMSHLIDDPECAHPDTSAHVALMVRPSPPHFEPAGGGQHQINLDEQSFLVNTDGDGVPVPESMLCF